jgi:hypothetical protein
MALDHLGQRIGCDRLARCFGRVRKMVPRSLDRLTHHNLDALPTPAAQVWVCVDERFLVPFHYLLEHLGCPAITVDGGVGVIHAG